MNDILQIVGELTIYILNHLGTVVGFIFQFVVLFVIAKILVWWFRLLLGIPARPKLSALEVARHLYPPPEMDKHAWLSRELNPEAMEKVIRKAELEAEHQWRIENDEHEGCAKCVVGLGMREMTTSKPVIRKSTMGAGLSVAYKSHGKVHTAILGAPHPTLDRIDNLAFHKAKGLLVFEGNPSEDPVAPYACKFEVVAQIRVRAGASMILDSDITKCSKVTHE